MRDLFAPHAVTRRRPAGGRRRTAGQVAFASHSAPAIPPE
ncbi:hypothetical protein A33M_3419 [Rhodovulum sp. PH10]|nr:hypothetical protein A33M_3419 [Rhodovulum sp. PH10]